MINRLLRRMINLSVCRSRPYHEKSMMIDVDSAPVNARDFAEELKKCVIKWENGKDYDAVWYNIPLPTHANLIPILTSENFVLHHVTTNSQNVFIYRWFGEGDSRIPPYAHTMVGIGAIVFNSKREILAAFQKFKERVACKLPGGYVDPSEELDEAVKREVLEETGIKTTFDSVVCFRHNQKANFDCGDLYFVAKLTAMSEEIKVGDELESCEWMTLEKYLNHPSVHAINRSILKSFLENEKRGFLIKKERGLHPVTKKPYSIYK